MTDANPGTSSDLQQGSLSEKLGQFEEQWAPRVIAELNGQEVKLARLEGPFEWHRHPEADELFLVLGGRLTIELREREDAELEEGDYCVVPAGTEHRPVAEEGEAQVLLFEPAGTRNTGNRESGRTVEDLERI